MKARAVAASFAIHVAVVVVLLLAAATVTRRPPIDIEIVPPQVTTAPPPPIASVAAPGGNPVIAPVPHRGEPPRRPHPRRVSPLPAARPPIDPPPAAPVVPDPELPEAPEAPETAALDGAEPSAGDGAGLGGSGGGTGRGRGTGDGPGDVDLSARPVPLNAAAFVILPYTEQAARDRVGGNVIVELMVDPLGRVGRATVARGLGHGLDEIATRTAMQLRFRPARDRAGRPTAATVRWRFRFDPP